MSPSTFGMFILALSASAETSGGAINRDRQRKCRAQPPAAGRLVHLKSIEMSFSACAWGVQIGGTRSRRDPGGGSTGGVSPPVLVLIFKVYYALLILTALENLVGG
jgi:hypothetical protein